MRVPRVYPNRTGGAIIEPEAPTAYIVFYVLPGKSAQLAADEDGSLLGFDLEQNALLYALRLAQHGLAACTRPITPGQAVEIVLGSGYSEAEAPDRFNLFEAQTTDEQDMQQWCLEHADRLARRVSE